MIKFIKNEKLIIFALIFTGFLSLLINLSINYNLSFSSKNKKAYELIEKFSKYPKPILIFANKNFEDFQILLLLEWWSEIVPLACFR